MWKQKCLCEITVVVWTVGVNSSMSDGDESHPHWVLQRRRALHAPHLGQFIYASEINISATKKEEILNKNLWDKTQRCLNFQDVRPLLSMVLKFSALPASSVFFPLLPVNLSCFCFKNRKSKPACASFS